MFLLLWCHWSKHGGRAGVETKEDRDVDCLFVAIMLSSKGNAKVGNGDEWIFVDTLIFVLVKVRFKECFDFFEGSGKKLLLGWVTVPFWCRRKISGSAVTRVGKKTAPNGTKRHRCTNKRPPLILQLTGYRAVMVIMIWFRKYGEASRKYVCGHIGTLIMSTNYLWGVCKTSASSRRSFSVQLYHSSLTWIHEQMIHELSQSFSLKLCGFN